MSRRTDRGTSLLEVLVAFAVLVVALSVLLPSLLASLSANARAREEWLATEFAASVMETVGPIRPLVEGGEEGTYGTRWIWRITIRPYRAPELPIGHRLVEVEVEIMRTAGGESLARLISLKAQGR